MTLPNLLGVLRILLTFLIIWLLCIPGFGPAVAACALFLLAAATDWVDGYLARRLNQVSRSGILLDPIADKVLVLGLFIAFAAQGLVAAWMVGLIVVREVLVTGVRLLVAAGRGGQAIPAAKDGKLKVVVQMVTASFVLVVLALDAAAAGGSLRQLSAGLALMIPWAMALATGLTVASGVALFVRNPAMQGPLAVLVATVGGLGYAPIASGTVGSVAGLVIGWWSVYAGPVLMWSGALAVTVFGIAASTRTEREVGRTDPSCIVIDECAAMWLIVACLRPQRWFTGSFDDLTAAGIAFILFRLFDILKPWPLKRLQDLPGGWGVVLDDLGAAGYTVATCAALFPLLMQLGWAALQH